MSGSAGGNLSQDLGFDLSGEVAMITGAGGGLGAAIARGLARTGARLLLADLAVEGINAAKRQIEEVGGDVILSLIHI